MKVRGYAYVFPPYKAEALSSPFFSVKGSETSKKRHILMHLRHWLLLHLFFSTNGDEMPSKKRHILMSAVTFSKNGLWIPLNAALHKKLSLHAIVSYRKYCTIKDGAQTYNFIADKSCLLFAIILDILSGWEVIRTHGKCIKSYKDVWKDFVVVTGQVARSHIARNQSLVARKYA